MKIRVKDWLQYVQQRLLDNTVTNRRDAECPYSAVRLGDFYPPDWLRSVTLVLKFVGKSGDLLGQLFGKVRDALAINTGCALVGFYFRKCPMKPLFLKHSVIETVIDSCHPYLTCVSLPGSIRNACHSWPECCPFLSRWAIWNSMIRIT